MLHSKTEIIRRSIPVQSELSADLPELLRRVYSARGITQQHELERDLIHLPAPSEIPGTAEAAKLLQQHIQSSSRIMIIGDFDADGATSCVLAVLALKSMGAKDVTYLVPNRFEYGYGLTPEIVDVALKQSPGVIVTVDNGISSISGVEAANQAGVPVLVTDHHLPGKELPKAAVIVNPNIQDEGIGKNLAGVGVLFYVLLALRARLREQQWFVEQSIVEPNLAEFLDLVALGTVADVVPLDRINRILVHQGLRRIRAGLCRPGIRALFLASGRSLDRAVASDLGFAIGPRLNAAGRLDDISLGIETLLTDSITKAEQGAFELNSFNQQRREIEDEMRQQAMAYLESIDLDAESEIPFGLSLFNEEWHQGVIGILASRIKDRYHRPVIAFAAADDEWIKGSARSISGVHIRDLLDSIAAKHPELINKFGGHAMAAGLTLLKRDLDRFSDAFDAEVREHLELDDIRGIIQSDGELPPQLMNIETAGLLREAGPWGQNFPEPIFDGKFNLVNWRIVGEKHLKMVLATENGDTIDAIAFNQAENYPANGECLLEAAYRLDVNEYRGIRSVQLIIEHLEWLNA